jgi:DNA-binding transcriptional LysR family regulator
MNFRQLQIFEAVARLHSFSRAAQELHIAQPAVSIAVRKLETEIELPLFLRNERQVQLTEAGELLLGHARSMLRQREQALEQIRELRGLDRGEVRIAMPAMHGAYFFPTRFVAFKARYPGLKLAVIEAGTAEIEERLLSGTIDLGVVMVDRVSDELEVKPFLREQLLAWVPADHRFATRHALGVAEFLEQPLVLTRPGYFMRETVDRLGAELGVHPRIEAETNLMLLTRALLLAGVGISTCMSMVARDDAELVGVPFDEPIHFNMGLAWRRSHHLSGANRAFVDFLLEEAAGGA